MKGWGPKSSVCPSKPGQSNFFGGVSRDFAGISRGHPKSLRKKRFVFNSRSLERGLALIRASLSKISSRDSRGFLEIL